MKKFNTLITLLVVLALAALIPKLMEYRSGGLERYLEAVDQSQAEMKVLADEMKESLKHSSEKLSSGEWDTEQIQGTILTFVTKVEGQKDRIESLAVPEEALAHHQLLSQKYTIVLEMSEKTIPMLEIAGKMIAMSVEQRSQGLSDSRREALMAEIQPLQVEMMEIQKEITELTSRGHKLEASIEAERSRLDAVTEPPE